MRSFLAQNIGPLHYHTTTRQSNCKRESLKPTEQTNIGMHETRHNHHHITVQPLHYK